MYQQEHQVPDGSAIEKLYRTHARGILRYINRSVFSTEDADDLLVEVFLAALESEVVLRLSEGEQSAWLQRVARNKIVDYQRRALKRSVVALEEAFDSPFEQDNATPETVTVAQEELTLLRARLATLPALYQRVLRLRFADGLRTKEIARHLNKSDGAIRSLLLRSLNLLRGLYQQSEEEEFHG